MDEVEVSAPAPAQPLGEVAAIRVLSDIVSRASLASKAGMTFSDARDLYLALGYKRDLRAKDFRDRYKRGGIAARIVNAAPQATWRGGAELIEDENPEKDTAFELEWEAFNERLQVWSVLMRADILSGIGRYAVVLIGAPGKLEEPLPDHLRSDDIKYLQPYGEDDATIVNLDEDPESERFGLPKAYNLRRMGRTERVVHWSRVLHIADNVLDDPVNGEPRLERPWNNLDDLDKVVGGGSEAFWIRVHQGMVFNLDKDVELDDPEKEALKTAIDEFVHNIRRTIATKGMNVEALGGDVANFSNQVDALVTLLAGTTGIPKRILVGSERGELSSTQDKTNWDELIADRRQEHAGPHIVKPLVDLLIKTGALPTPKEWTIRWPELIQMDNAQRADIATKWADLNTKTGELVVKGAEIRDRVLGLDKLKPEDLVTRVFTPQQVTSVLEIVSQVGSGDLTPDTAVLMLVHFFDMDKKIAQELIDGVEPLDENEPVMVLDPETGLPVPAPENPGQTAPVLPEPPPIQQDGQSIQDGQEEDV